MAMDALLGYARVSTDEQDFSLQHDALRAAGCVRIFSDTASGALDERPKLTEALDHVRAGDTLVVWRLDRLGRSLRHLIDTVTALAERGVGFRSLQESLDTTSSGGRLVFHLFGALAEFERELIRERTNAGLAAARARGRKGGRPTVMTPDKLKIAREMYDSRKHTTAAIAAVVGVSRATLYRALTPSPLTDNALSPSAIEQPVAPSATADDREACAPTPARPVLATAPPPAIPAPPRNAVPKPAKAPRRSPARAAELPSDAAALARECPSCGARAGVMCKNTRSRAKRKPAAARMHRARYWLDRRCPTCRARPDEPCRTPTGAETNPHAARLKNSDTEYHAYLEQTNAPDLASR